MDTTGKSNMRNKYEELRRRAEENLKRQESRTGIDENSIDARTILHELDVYQTELELQNEELRSVQGQLEETLNRYADLYDHAPLGYFSLDKNLLILNVNLTASGMLNTERKNLMGKPFLLYVSYDYKDAFREYTDLLLKHRDMRGTKEIKILRKDGSTFYALLESIRIENSEDEIVEIRTTLQDISVRKRLEEEMEQKNSELSDFTYRVSHDLKSPIQLIHSYIEMIEAHPEDTLKYLSVIRGQVDKLSEFIDNLLRLSRAGRVIGEKQIFPLSMPLNHIISTLQTKDIPVDIKLDLKVKEIQTDFEAILTVFSNLLENAMKYRDPRKEKLIIEVSSRQYSDRVILSFKDNGMGIEEKYLEKVFQPGFIITKGTGTGFGLAITKKIIEALGGYITVQSPGIDRGSEFIINLPAY